MTNEMLKLRRLLDYYKIPWEDDSDPDTFKLHIDRTKFHVELYDYSVVHGFGTYGGWSSYNKDKGLLELRINSGEPTGWKTAEDIMKIVLENKGV